MPKRLALTPEQQALLHSLQQREAEKVSRLGSIRVHRERIRQQAQAYLDAEKTVQENEQIAVRELLDLQNKIRETALGVLREHGVVSGKYAIDEHGISLLEE